MAHLAHNLKISLPGKLYTGRDTGYNHVDGMRDFFGDFLGHLLFDTTKTAHNINFKLGNAR